MMVTIKVIRIRMMRMMVVVTMVIIVVSVVEDLKEELTEGHLLTPEERASSHGDGGGVSLHGRVLLPPALLPVLGVLLLLHPAVSVSPEEGHDLLCCDSLELSCQGAQYQTDCA